MWWLLSWHIRSVFPNQSYLGPQREHCMTWDFLVTCITEIGPADLPCFNIHDSRKDRMISKYFKIGGVPEEPTKWWNTMISLSQSDSLSSSKLKQLRKSWAPTSIAIICNHCPPTAWEDRIGYSHQKGEKLPAQWSEPNRFQELRIGIQSILTFLSQLLCFGLLVVEGCKRVPPKMTTGIRVWRYMHILDSGMTGLSYRDMIVGICDYYLGIVVAQSNKLTWWSSKLSRLDCNLSRMVCSFSRSVPRFFVKALARSTDLYSTPSWDNLGNSYK